MPTLPSFSSPTRPLDSRPLSRAAALARGRPAASAPEVLATARDRLTEGPEGLLAAAALVSAWELPEAPRLAEVPEELRTGYLEWLLAAPAAPATDIAPGLALHLATRVTELADWMELNLAAPTVRAATDTYLRLPAPPLAHLPAEGRLALQEARARVLQRSQGRLPPAALPASPRQGRALRVGVLHARFDHRPETFATLARCAQLDPERVELHALAFESTGSPLEERWREFARAFHVLPDRLPTQFHALRTLELDCLVFGDPLAGHPLPLAYLAQLRAAPLQIATDALGSSLGAIDLLLSGELDPNARQARFHSERLALLPGTALAWDCGLDRGTDSVPWTRASLGLTDDQPLLVASAPERLDPSLLEGWSEFFQRVPSVGVLLVPAPGASDLGELRAAIAAAGLPRLRLHEPAPFDHGALASLFALADLALAPSGPATILALEAGVPTLVAADRPEAALLLSAGLGEWIAPDAELFARAAAFFTKPGALGDLRDQVAAAMERFPRFADNYALAADFTSLLETAWDDLCATGPAGFRRHREPLRLAKPSPIAPELLRAEGLALLAQGRPKRAVACLLSALHRAGSEPELWLDLARAQHVAGQSTAALVSLEASLRIDGAQDAAWRLLCELALSAGNHELAREALGLATALAEDHPDLPSLRARLV